MYRCCLLCIYMRALDRSLADCRYESVFVGFIVHLTVEEVNEVKRMPDVDKVEKTGLKFDKTAPRGKGAEGDEKGAGPGRRLSNNAWSRHLGKRGTWSEK